MKTEWIIVADFAEVINGKLYTMGAGWDSLTVNQMPYQQPFAIAAAFLVDWNETNFVHDIAIDFIDEDGKQLATINGQMEVGRPPGATPGLPQRLILAVNIQHQFHQLGTYVIRTRIAGQDSDSLRFRVVPGPQLLAQQVSERRPSPDG